MEKKDLAIGRKYLHKGNREVYYLGESKMGDSIVQPTDGINGIVSLKECHPELKDIIGNDKFWGYFSMHLELLEIEPKYLTVDELVDGEIYFGKFNGCDIIFMPNNHELCDNKNFYNGNVPEEVKEIIEATQEQKDWLNACIEADKFVPKEKALDLQYGDKFKFTIGKWYKFNWDWRGPNYPVIIKVSKYSDDCVCSNFRIYLNNIEINNKYEDVYVLKEISNIKEITDLSEIQEFLPDGHSDKLVKGSILPEKWCIKPKNEKQLELIYNYGAKEYGEGKDCEYYYHYPEFKPKCFARDYITKGYTEITFEQFKKYVLKQEEKPIEKWSSGSYIVIVNQTDGVLLKAGTVRKIKSFESKYIHIDGDCLDIIRESDGDIKWFATLEEAKEFSDSLKNEKMNSFKKGDYIVITSPNEDSGGFITNYCYKQRDDNYYLRPELTTLGDTHNGWIYIDFRTGKWRYATVNEAKIYEKLGIPFDVNNLNKSPMNYKFKVGDKVKVVKTGYGVGNTHEPFVTITSLGVYSDGPGYSVEPKIGNSLSGVYGGMIKEQSFELYEEEWIPKVGDWVVIVNPNGIGNWNHRMNEYVGKCVKLISIARCNFNSFKINEDNGHWCWEYSERYKFFRKALPHEIPSENNTEDVVDDDYSWIEEQEYKFIHYPPPQHQYQWTVMDYNPKDNMLDLSLRDEKEVNVNEVKSSNNNISKLNLSLNN